MKVLVTIDDDLMQRVDRMLDARGMSRSAYFVNVILQDIERSDEQRAVKISQAVDRLREIAARYPADSDSTDDIRAMRDAP